MIKVNLTPDEELESPIWYVPDLVMLAVVIIATFFGVRYYLGTIQDQIDGKRVEFQALAAEHEQIKPDIERFRTLDQDIQRLNARLSALSEITVTKVAKYKPVIVLEHLQNLKPEGLWFREIHNTEGSSLTVRGAAFDNLLVAEFLASLRATQSQEFDPTDLRSQISFENIDLTGSTKSGSGDATFPELGDLPFFIMTTDFAERGENGEIKIEEQEETNTSTVAEMESPPADSVRM